VRTPSGLFHGMGDVAVLESQGCPKTAWSVVLQARSYHGIVRDASAVPDGLSTHPLGSEAEMASAYMAWPAAYG
jgi:hypothetical protein